jgi:hypothetical protein
MCVNQMVYNMTVGLPLHRYHDIFDVIVLGTSRILQLLWLTLANGRMKVAPHTLL